MVEELITRPEIDPLIHELETLRKGIVRRKRIRYAIAILGYIPMVFDSVAGTATLSLALTTVLILFTISRKKSVQYKQRFKTELLPLLLKATDPSFTYESHKGISAYEVADALIFVNLNRLYATEDLISGKVDKTSFKFAEVSMKSPTFKGIVFIADFNKNFNGLTLVKPKKWSSKIHSASILQLQPIILEDVNFRNAFYTYGSDQIEARYILTPSLMEKIASLNKVNKEDISVSFVKSTMYIALPRKRNYFEAPIGKSLLEPTTLAENLDLLTFMKNIIKEMDLNTRIWTKKEDEPSVKETIDLGTVGKLKIKIKPSTTTWTQQSSSSYRSNSQ